MPRQTCIPREDRVAPGDHRKDWRAKRLEVGISNAEAARLAVREFKAAARRIKGLAPVVEQATDEEARTFCAACGTPFARDGFARCYHCERRGAK